MKRHMSGPGRPKGKYRQTMLGEWTTFGHSPVLDSLSHVRAKIYGRRLDAGAFRAVIHGFDTTSENLAGLLPVLFGSARFHHVGETRRIRTLLGIVSLYPAMKGGSAPALHSAGGTA